MSSKTKSEVIPTVEYEDIDSGIRRITSNYDMKISNKEGILFSKGDILFGKLRPYLKNHILSDFKGKAVGDFWVLRSIKNTSTFNFYLIDTPFFVNISNISTGTRMPRSDWNTLNQFAMYIPEKKESIKIGAFFQLLDNLIALYQRKNELFSKVITGYNQLVFSNNKTRPILRFNSYNEDWENFQVKDLFRVTRGQVLATHLTKEEPDCEYCYPVYSSQTKNNGLLGYYNKYLFDSAITWTTDGANAGTVNFRSGKFYSTNVNGVLLSEKGYANSAVAEALNSIAWKYVSRVGNPKLMNNVMQDISIMIPPTIDEQMRISFSIEKLKEIFIKNSSNIQHLQKLKKVYLNKLFI